MESDTATPGSVCQESIPTTPIQQTNTKIEVIEHEIIIGKKYYVRLSNHMDSEEEIQYRIGEILANRTNNEGNQEYYIHFIDFNKRLDEWVSESRIDVKRDVIVEKPKLTTPRKTMTTNLSLDVVPSTPPTTTTTSSY